MRRQAPSGQRCREVLTGQQRAGKGARLNPKGVRTIIPVLLDFHCDMYIFISNNLSRGTVKFPSQFEIHIYKSLYLSVL